MALYKFLYPPDKITYVVTDPKETLYTSLDGGMGRYRHDIAGGAQMLKAQWTFDRAKYEYFRAFYSAATVQASLPFSIDLMIEYHDLTEHVAHFIPGSVRMAETSGHRYVVTVQMEVEPVERDDAYDRAILMIHEVYGGSKEWINPLERLVNFDLPFAVRGAIGQPPKATDLTATSVAGSFEIELNWTTNPGATHYVIMWAFADRYQPDMVPPDNAFQVLRPDPADTDVRVTAPPISLTHVPHTFGVTLGQKYWFRVYGIDEQHIYPGLWSEPASVVATSGATGYWQFGKDNPDYNSVLGVGSKLVPQTPSYLVAHPGYLEIKEAATGTTPLRGLRAETTPVQTAAFTFAAVFRRPDTTSGVSLIYDTLVSGPTAQGALVQVKTTTRGIELIVNDAAPGTYQIGPGVADQDAFYFFAVSYDQTAQEIETFVGHNASGGTAHWYGSHSGASVKQTVDLGSPQRLGISNAYHATTGNRGAMDIAEAIYFPMVIPPAQMLAIYDDSVRRLALRGVTVK